MTLYDHIKTLYPDAVVFLRVGDFYETDAEAIPHHAIEEHIVRLVGEGRRVAVAERVK